LDGPSQYGITCTPEHCFPLRLPLYLAYSFPTSWNDNSIIVNTSRMCCAHLFCIFCAMFRGQIRLRRDGESPARGGETTGLHRASSGKRVVWRVSLLGSTVGFLQRRDVMTCFRDQKMLRRKRLACRLPAQTVEVTRNYPSLLRWSHAPSSQRFFFHVRRPSNNNRQQTTVGKRGRRIQTWRAQTWSLTP
jgi:hypothetical protein